LTRAQRGTRGGVLEGRGRGAARSAGAARAVAAPQDSSDVLHCCLHGARGAAARRSGYGRRHRTGRDAVQWCASGPRCSAGVALPLKLCSWCPQACTPPVTRAQSDVRAAPAVSLCAGWTAAARFAARDGRAAAPLWCSMPSVALRRTDVLPASHTPPLRLQWLFRLGSNALIARAALHRSVAGASSCAHVLTSACAGC
jgi:hypothetical protein